MERKRYEGFSLIEILVVVALIIILATITIVAINPGKNFRDTRNAQRSSDVNSILNAVTQYTTDGLPLTAFGTIAECTNGATPIGTGTGNANLTVLTEGDANYIVSIPLDPSGGTAENTGYTICTIGTRVQIAAPNAEAGKVIEVKR
mgnify:CR=1 FL=1